MLLFSTLVLLHVDVKDKQKANKSITYISILSETSTSVCEFFLMQTAFHSRFLMSLMLVVIAVTCIAARGFFCFLYVSAEIKYGTKTPFLSFSLGDKTEGGIVCLFFAWLWPLFVCMVGWPVGRPADWLSGWWVGWLTGWLFGCFDGWLARCHAGWLVVLVSWLVCRLICWI